MEDTHNLLNSTNQSLVDMTANWHRLGGEDNQMQLANITGEKRYLNMGEHWGVAECHMPM